MLYALLFNYYWSLNMIGCFCFLSIIFSCYSPYTNINSRKRLFITFYYDTHTHVTILLHILIIFRHKHTPSTHKHTQTERAFVFLQLKTHTKEGNHTQNYTRELSPTHLQHTGTHITYVPHYIPRRLLSNSYWIKDEIWLQLCFELLTACECDRYYTIRQHQYSYHTVSCVEWVNIKDVTVSLWAFVCVYVRL